MTTLVRNHSNHLLIVGAGVAGLLLLAAIGVPVWSYLPILALFAVCPVMMLLMMRGMSHGSSKGPGEDVDPPTRTSNR